MYYSDNATMGEVCPYECKKPLNWFKNKSKLHFLAKKLLQKL